MTDEKLKIEDFNGNITEKSHSELPKRFLSAGALNMIWGKTWVSLGL